MEKAHQHLDPAHLIPVGKLHHCFLRTSVSLTGFLFCSSSRVGQDPQSYGMFAGYYFVFRLEVGVLASGFVCETVEVPGAQVVSTTAAGTSLVLKMST